MDLRNRICNLCLIKCENYKPFEGNMKTAMDTLLPSIEFTVIREPVMCKTCEEMLWKCFAFKEKCLNSHDDSVPLGNKDAVKLDLKDACLRTNTTGVGVPENHEVCGFCMNLVKCYAVSLEVDKGRLILRKMIERCLPELDLSVIKNPIICADCHRSLENCFRFVTNCLATAERIKKYFESFGVKSKGQIDLNNLLHSIMSTVEECDRVGNVVEIIEAEKPSCMKIENPEESEIGAIKLEQMSYNEYVNVIGNKNESMSGCAEEENMLGTVKTEETFCAENETKPEDGDGGEIYDQKCIVKEEIEKQTDDRDFNRFDECTVMTQTSVNISLNSRQKCLKSKLPHIKQSLQGNPSEVTLFKCDSCTFQTKQKSYLKRHALIHMDPSQVTMFKCDSCPFQTKRKYDLKKHMLKHTNFSGATLFSCHSCLFQTTRKDTLKRHVLKHMHPSEVTMFKCDSCSFQTKRKHALKVHALKHMDSSEVTMFTCDSCPFQTRWKGTFKSHALKHLDPSEVVMFKCDSCPFESQRKYRLKRHALKHMDPSDVTMFKCDFCSFESRWKDKLKSHALNHMAPSEVTRFKCDFCSFQSIRKDKLKCHALNHMAPSEVTMFKCDSCPFESRKEYSLKSHVLKHMDPSEVAMFKCDSCPFQTKRKRTLNDHALKHMDSSEVTMFTCDSCLFQTRRKKNLKRHMLKHMNPSQYLLVTSALMRKNINVAESDA